MPNKTSTGLPQPQKKPAGKRSGRLFIVLVWAFILLVFSSLGIVQLNRYRSYRRESDRLAAAIQAELETAQDIQRQREFFASDQFIIQTARDRLGLIMPDEWVFVNVAD